MGNGTFVFVNGKRIWIEYIQTFVRQAGRRSRRWHRFLKGWCRKLGRFVTFCLGIVKGSSILDPAMEQIYQNARILFDAFLEQMGAEHALSVLSMPVWWSKT